MNNATKKIPVIIGFIVGIIAAVIFVIYFFNSIDIGSSSTAVLAYIWMPIYGVFAFIVVFFYGWMFGKIVQCIIHPNQKAIFISLVAFIVLGSTAYFLTVTIKKGLYIKQQVSQLIQANTNELNSYYKQHFPHHTVDGYRVYLLAAIAQNPNASAALLSKIARINDMDLEKRLHSYFDFELLGKNIDGLSVQRLITSNPNVAPNTLVYLAEHSSDPYMQSDLSRNEKTPKFLLRELFMENSKAVDRRLAYNPSTPVDILVDLASSPDTTTRSFLTENPSTPLVIIKKLVKDKNDSVRWKAKYVLKKRLQQ
ncbi:MAG: hypothetical protein P1U63_08095 [Coxiellaceae bacterium]|nr:hypothetical protein [Coxiellaceae bacterium]